MSDAAVEERDAQEELEERSPYEPEQEQASASDEQGPSLSTWTTVGAVVGATAGGVIGAVVAATLVRKPELLDQAREAINRDGGRVARAATTAAGGVLAAKSVQGLAQDAGNGDRTTLMKQTAREAAAAAAGATRDEIVSIRQAKSSS
ncbi:MAG TPA: hypothetical protein VFJ75_10970 [Gaiellaceae bacterium]|nr:hypothetical protein [Gaiellaceae bacterium]